MTPEESTPRISLISGTVTGCLYAMTANVSNACSDRRTGGFKLLGKVDDHVVMLGLGTHAVATSDLANLHAAVAIGVLDDQFP